MPAPRRSRPDPHQQLRHDLMLALRKRGYRARRRSQVVGHKEFRSPSRKVGSPLVAMRHVILVADDGEVRMLREGAPIDDMIDLPQRTVDVLLSGAGAR